MDIKVLTCVIHIFVLIANVSYLPVGSGCFFLEFLSSNLFHKKKLLKVFWFSNGRSKKGVRGMLTSPAPLCCSPTLKSSGIEKPRGSDAGSTPIVYALASTRLSLTHFRSTFGVHKVSTLSHTYPHRPLRNIKMAIGNHQIDCPFYLWPDVCYGDLKAKQNSVVIRDTECPY